MSKIITALFNSLKKIEKLIAYKVELKKYIVLKNKFKKTSIQLNIQDYNHYNLCNPSIISTDYGWIVIIRLHNTSIDKYGRNWTIHGEKLSNKIWIINFDNNFNIKNSQHLNIQSENIENLKIENGLEDGRIFKLKDKIYILSSTCNLHSNTNNMVLGELVNDHYTNLIYIDSCILNQNEKNWMPIIQDTENGMQNDILAIYSVSPLKIFNLTKIKFEEIQSELNKDLEKFSGSSQVIPFDNGYLCVVHKRMHAPKGGKFYIHKFLYFNLNYSLIKTSISFFIEKRQSVEFCAGLAIKGNRLVLSFGTMDKEAKLMEFSTKEIDKLWN